MNKGGVVGKGVGTTRGCFSIKDRNNKEKTEEKFEDDLYGEMYGLINFFIEEMSGCRGEEEIRKICRKIYKNRKKLGLFTKQDKLDVDK